MSDSDTPASQSTTDITASSRPLERDEEPESPSEVPLDELVWVQYLAAHERFEGVREGPETRRYRRARARFERDRGRIVQEWWSTSEAAGLLLTERVTLRWPAPLLGRRRETTLHRFTDWLTLDTPEVARLLHAGDNIALRSSEVVAGSPQRVGLAHLFGLASGLLGVVESGKRAGSRDLDHRSLGQALRWYRDGLSAAERYYKETAARTAQIFYFGGTVLGASAIALLTAVVMVATYGLLRVADIDISSILYAEVVAAVSAGGLGAVVSVMWRMSSGDFESEYEAGRDHLRMIGAFRPFIGSVFGLGVYFATRGGVVSLGGDDPDFYFLTFIAFLGGFSERFAPDVFGEAEAASRGRMEKGRAAPRVIESERRPLVPSLEIEHATDEDEDK